MDKYKKYIAVLFTPDGDIVTDYAADTVEEVWENVEDGGSRWIFYPIAMVVRYDGYLDTAKRIVDTSEAFEWAKGRSVKVVKRIMASDPQKIVNMLY